MKSVWIVELDEDNNGDVFFELPIDLLQQLGWNIGDTLELNTVDGNITLSKP